MNRTIKFRGWSTSLKKWHYGYLVQLHGGTWINDGNVALLVDPESVGQMIDVVELEIGKHQEIYEGDIFIDRAGNKYEVNFSFASYQWELGIAGTPINKAFILGWKLIGNTYESKLKEKEVGNE